MGKYKIILDYMIADCDIEDFRLCVYSEGNAKIKIEPILHDETEKATIIRACYNTILVNRDPQYLYRKFDGNIAPKIKIEDMSCWGAKGITK